MKKIKLKSKFLKRKIYTSHIRYHFYIQKNPEQFLINFAFPSYQLTHDIYFVNEDFEECGISVVINWKNDEPANGKQGGNSRFSNPENSNPPKNSVQYCFVKEKLSL